MLQSIRNVWKVTDLRRKIGFTVLMLLIVRLGSQLPLPGINRELFSGVFSSGDAWDFFNMITGGSMEQMSLFALNITPYITASIIIQLLAIAVPKLEELRKDGEEGRKKLEKYTRITAVVLSLVQATAMTIGFGRSGYLTSFTPLPVIALIAGMTGGSVLLMWIGERITKKGVGNGISIILAVNILSRIPGDFIALYEQFIAGKKLPFAILAGAVILGIVSALILFIILLQGGERKIPIQGSAKMGNRRTPLGRSSIPMKVNTAGVMPVIFAQSLMQTPLMIASVFGAGNGNHIGDKILQGLNQNNWFNPSGWVYTLGAALYLVLLIAFAYFYTSITFNPYEITENLKRSGASIPGIRPGKPTCDYLKGILKYVIFIGAIALAVLAFVPIILNGLAHASVSFGGTSLIIVVGVILETIKSVESQMQVHNYNGFLSRKA